MNECRGWKFHPERITPIAESEGFSFLFARSMHTLHTLKVEVGYLLAVPSPDTGPAGTVDVAVPTTHTQQQSTSPHTHHLFTEQPGDRHNGSSWANHVDMHVAHAPCREVLRKAALLSKQWCVPYADRGGCMQASWVHGCALPSPAQRPSRQERWSTHSIVPPRIWVVFYTPRGRFREFSCGESSAGEMPSDSAEEKLSSSNRPTSLPFSSTRRYSSTA